MKNSTLFIKEFCTYLKFIDVQHIVLCPGARNLEIMVAMTTSNLFQCYSIIDERQAAFFALALALQGKKTLVVTTSGTATFNTLSALVEAYHQQIPLYVLSADRTQFEKENGFNQTTFQEHMCSSLPILNINLNEHQELDLKNHLGPIHFNLSLEDITVKDEFKHKVDFLCSFNIDVQNSQFKKNDFGFLDPAKIFVFGQQSSFFAPEVECVINEFIRHRKIAFYVDAGSCYFMAFAHLQNRIMPESLCETIDHCNELVAHFGQNVLVKDYNEKILRKNHFVHIHYFDTNYGKKFNQRILFNESSYSLNSSSNSSSNASHSDLKKINVYVANSSIIRDFNELQNHFEDIHIFSTRGVSGIEGGLAITSALALDAPTLSLIGDVSFFYDLSSLELLSRFNGSFIIVLFNNNGGRIFDILLNKVSQEDVKEVIDQKKFDEQFLKTNYLQNFGKIIKAFDIDYEVVNCKNQKEWLKREFDHMVKLLKSSKSKTIKKIIEIKI